MSTASVTLSAVAAPADVPGLSLSVDVPSLSSYLVISSDGGVQVGNSTSGKAVAVDIMLFIDGQTTPNQIVQRRVMAVNNVIVPWVSNWAFSVSLTGLTPGTHTFRVAAQFVVASSSTSVVVAGASGSPLRGTLTGIVINP